MDEYSTGFTAYGLTLDNLWNDLNHFYDKVTPTLKEQFTFKDLAGIYTENETTRLFATCIRVFRISEKLLNGEQGHALTTAIE